MGLQLFRKQLNLASEVEHKTVFGLLKMIESERLGEAVDRTLLNHLLKMLTALEIYPESFEKTFLECTSEFYVAEGVKYMQQSDVPDYLKHAEMRLQEGHERCLLYVDASTRKPLVATAERQLLERHIYAILDKAAFNRSFSSVLAIPNKFTNFIQLKVFPPVLFVKANNVESHEQMRFHSLAYTNLSACLRKKQMTSEINTRMSTRHQQLALCLARKFRVECAE